MYASHSRRNRLLRTIASRVRDELDSSSTGQQRKGGKFKSGSDGYNNMNLKTVAVLPVSRNVPVEAFSKKLQAALEGIGASTAYLNQAIIANQLGRHAFTRMGKLKVCKCSLFNCQSFNAFRSLQDGSLTRSRDFGLSFMWSMRLSIALGRKLVFAK